MKISILSSSLFAFLMVLPSAFADTTSTLAPNAPTTEANPISADGASVTTSSSNWYGTALDSLYVNYFANFHGSPLNDPSFFKTPNTNSAVGKQGRNMYFDSTLTTAYKITQDIGVGPEINFDLEPVLGRGATLKDSGIKAYNRHQIQSGGFNVSSNLILQAPTDYSRQQGIDFSVKTTPNVRYDVPASRFTVGSFTEAKAYLGANTGKKSFKLYAGPYVNYQLSPSFALTTVYEMEANHFTGKPKLDFTSVNTDLQPGVRWNITRNVLVNPYVNLYTGNKITAANSSIGAIISATVL